MEYYDLQYGLDSVDSDPLYIEFLCKDENGEKTRNRMDAPFAPYCLIERGAFGEIPWGSNAFNSFHVSKGSYDTEVRDETPDGYVRLTAEQPGDIGAIRRAMDAIRDDREAARRVSEDIEAGDASKWLPEAMVSDEYIDAERTADDRDSNSTNLPPGRAYLNSETTTEAKNEAEKNAEEKLEKTEEPPLTYQADVPYGRRVLIDEGYQLNVPDPSDVLYFDIEVDPSGGFPEPEDATADVLSVAAVDGEGNEFFLSGTEREIFDGLVGDPTTHDDRMAEPDHGLLADYFVLVGWNSESFDLPYLKNRMENAGYGHSWPGFDIIHFDGMGLYRSFKRKKQESYALDAVAENEVDDSKDMDEDESYKNLRQWADEGNPRLREYNLHDAVLTRKIAEKFSLVETTARLCRQGFSRMASITYDSGGYPRVAVGKPCDSVILREAKRQGFVFGDRGRYKETGEFPGGYVFEPTPGTHSWVFVADFSSMYPSIIQALNIGENTWIPKQGDMTPEDVDGMIHGVNQVFDAGDRARGGFKQPAADGGEEGVLSTATRKISTLADEYKAKRNDSTPGTPEHEVYATMYEGLKTVKNSMYGVIASPLHRYYLPGMSEHITETGQFLIRECERFVSDDLEDVSRVVGGDTDSVFIELDEDDPDADPEAIEDRCKAVTEKLTTHIQDLVREEMNADASHLELDVDYVARKFVQTDKKKAYAAHIVREDGNPQDENKIVGLKCKKSDTMDAAAELQKSLVDALLADEPTGMIIKAYKHAFFSGAKDEKIVKHSSLGKRLSCGCSAGDASEADCECDVYKGNTASKRAAEMYNLAIEAGAITGVKLGRGDSVSYVKYGKEREKTLHPEIIRRGLAFRKVDPEGGAVHGEDVGDVTTGESFSWTPGKRRYVWGNYMEKAIRQINLDPSGTEQAGLGAFI